MTHLAGRLSSVLIPAVLLMSGTAMAASSSTQDKIAIASHAESFSKVAWFIRGGCPYNLDKSCYRGKNGKAVCHCVS
jgi:hypothetical protein